MQTRAPKYSDQAFLSGMLANHKGAWDLARLELGGGVDKRARHWAGIVLSGQERDIKAIHSILNELGGPDELVEAAMRENMGRLTHNLDRQDPDLGFVNSMLAHHADALDLTREALIHSGNLAVVDLAGIMIMIQTKEINAFKHWLAEGGH